MIGKGKLQGAVTLVACSVLGAVSGCGGHEQGPELADTNTSWLQPCRVDADCASARCEQGYCAAPGLETPAMSDDDSVPPQQGDDPANDAPPSLGGQSIERMVADWDVRISPDNQQAGPPSARWVDERFVVAWVGEELVLRAEITPDGEFTRQQTPLDLAPFVEVRLGDEGEVALLGGTSFFVTETTIAVLDPALSSITSKVPCGTGYSVDAVPIGGGDWMVVCEQEEGDERSILLRRLTPGAATPLSEPLATMQMTHPDQDVSLFASADEALVAWPTLAGGSLVYQAEGLSIPGGATVSEPTVLAAAGLTADGQYGFGRLSGHTLMFGIDDASLWAARIDTAVARPVAATNVGDRRPGVAVAKELGGLGVCFATGPGPYGGAAGEGDGVSFVLVNAEGSVVSGPTVVADAMNNIGGCSIAWSGDAFLVAYWQIGPTETDAYSELRAQLLVPDSGI